MPKASTAAKVQNLPTALFDARITGVLLFSCYYSNPQGDPDNNNAPRVDDHSFGIVTPQGIKRKIRDVWTMGGHHIHVSRKADLSEAIIKAAKDQGIDIAAKKGHNLSAEDKNKVIKAAAAIYTDIRAFGGVLTSLNEGVTGPVQFTPAISVDPVAPLELSTTRVAVANEEERKTKDRTMGSMHVVPYGLYRVEFSISSWDAERTGFTWRDVDALIDAMKCMFDLTKSSGRSKLVPERLITFKHSNKLGDTQDHRLQRLITVQRKSSVSAATKYEDYEVSINSGGIPDSVTIEEHI